ncbi:thioredoxin h, partial [Gorgonomyces haynaldii]
DFKTVLQKQAVIIDFTASWCGPCKFIAPIYDQLSNEHPNIHFAKLDVDEVRQIAAQEGISAMPTFIAYLNGQRVDTLQGADKNGIVQLIQ